MTLSEDDVSARLRQAVVQANWAPSVHNTQPWRFVIGPGYLEIYADWSRQLKVLDPTGRQLIISCGCAALNARASLAASGCGVSVDRRPDPARPDLLVRLNVTETQVPDSTLADLDAEIELRRTNRRRFADEPVPSEVVDALVAAASVEDAELIQVLSAEHRLITASLSQRADREENANPAYRAELRAWTTSDPRRRDGVPAFAVPHVDGGAHDDIPMRDFDTQGMGWLPVETHSDINQCLLLLGTYDDNPKTWLTSGEALERVLLEATKRGFAVSPLTQVIEIASTRTMLRDELALTMHPHVLLRVGRAPKTTAARRRLPSDLTEERPLPPVGLSNNGDRNDVARTDVRS